MRPCWRRRYTAGDLDELRISKTYELSPLDDPAQIPTEDFERSGLHYTLLDIIKEDQTETDSKYYTETVTLDSDSKDMEKIMPLLAATCEATTEDGYFDCSRREAIHKVRETDFDKKLGLQFDQPPPQKKRRDSCHER